MIHYNKDKIITNLFYAPVWYVVQHDILRYRTVHIVGGALVLLLMRIFVVEYGSIPLMIVVCRRTINRAEVGDRYAGFQTLRKKRAFAFTRSLTMVVCPSHNQPQDQPNKGQPKEAISKIYPQFIQV